MFLGLGKGFEAGKRVYGALKKMLLGQWKERSLGQRRSTVPGISNRVKISGLNRFGDFGLAGLEASVGRAMIFAMIFAMTVTRDLWAWSALPIPGGYEIVAEPPKGKPQEGILKNPDLMALITQVLAAGAESLRISGPRVTLSGDLTVPHLDIHAAYFSHTKGRLTAQRVTLQTNKAVVGQAERPMVAKGPSWLQSKNLKDKPVNPSWQVETLQVTKGQLVFSGHLQAQKVDLSGTCGLRGLAQVGSLTLHQGVLNLCAQNKEKWTPSVMNIGSLQGQGRVHNQKSFLRIQGDKPFGVGLSGTPSPGGTVVQGTLWQGKQDTAWFAEASAYRGLCGTKVTGSLPSAVGQDKIQELKGLGLWAPSGRGPVQLMAWTPEREALLTQEGPEILDDEGRQGLWEKLLQVPGQATEKMTLEGHWQGESFQVITPGLLQISGTVTSEHHALFSAEKALTLKGTITAQGAIQAQGGDLTLNQACLKGHQGVLLQGGRFCDKGLGSKISSDQQGVMLQGQSLVLGASQIRAAQDVTIAGELVHLAGHQQRTKTQEKLYAYASARCCPTKVAGKSIHITGHHVALQGPHLESQKETVLTGEKVDYALGRYETLEHTLFKKNRFFVETTYKSTNHSWGPVKRRITGPLHIYGQKVCLEGPEGGAQGLWEETKNWRTSKADLEEETKEENQDQEKENASPSSQPDNSWTYPTWPPELQKTIQQIFRTQSLKLGLTDSENQRLWGRLVAFLEAAVCLKPGATQEPHQDINAYGDEEKRSSVLDSPADFQTDSQEEWSWAEDVQEKEPQEKRVSSWGLEKIEENPFEEDVSEKDGPGETFEKTYGSWEEKGSDFNPSWQPLEKHSIFSDDTNHPSAWNPAWHNSFGRQGCLSEEDNASNFDPHLQSRWRTEETIEEKSIEDTYPDTYPDTYSDTYPEEEFFTPRLWGSEAWDISQTTSQRSWENLAPDSLDGESQIPHGLTPLPFDPLFKRALWQGRGEDGVKSGFEPVFDDLDQASTQETPPETIQEWAQELSPQDLAQEIDQEWGQYSPQDTGQEWAQYSPQEIDQDTNQDINWAPSTQNAQEDFEEEETYEEDEAPWIPEAFRLWQEAPSSFEDLVQLTMQELWIQEKLYPQPTPTPKEPPLPPQSIPIPKDFPANTFIVSQEKPTLKIIPDKCKNDQDVHRRIGTCFRAMAGIGLSMIPGGQGFGGMLLGAAIGAVGQHSMDQIDRAMNGQRFSLRGFDKRLLQGGIHSAFSYGLTEGLSRIWPSNATANATAASLPTSTPLSTSLSSSAPLSTATSTTTAAAATSTARIPLSTLTTPLSTLGAACTTNLLLKKKFNWKELGSQCASSLVTGAVANQIGAARANQHLSGLETILGHGLNGALGEMARQGIMDEGFDASQITAAALGSAGVGVLSSLTQVGLELCFSSQEELEERRLKGQTDPSQTIDRSLVPTACHLARLSMLMGAWSTGLNPDAMSTMDQAAQITADNNCIFFAPVLYQLIFWGCTAVSIYYASKRIYDAYEKNGAAGVMEQLGIEVKQYVIDQIGGRALRAGFKVAGKIYQYAPDALKAAANRAGTNVLKNIQKTEIFQKVTKHLEAAGQKLAQGAQVLQSKIDTTTIGKAGKKVTGGLNKATASVNGVVDKARDKVTQGVKKAADKALGKATGKGAEKAAGAAVVAAQSVAKGTQKATNKAQKSTGQAPQKAPQKGGQQNKPSAPQAPKGTKRPSGMTIKEENALKRQMLEEKAKEPMKPGELKTERSHEELRKYVRKHKLKGMEVHHMPTAAYTEQFLKSDKGKVFLQKNNLSPEEALSKIDWKEVYDKGPCVLMQKARHQLLHIKLRESIGAQVPSTDILPRQALTQTIQPFRDIYRHAGVYQHDGEPIKHVLDGMFKAIESSQKDFTVKGLEGLNLFKK